MWSEETKQAPARRQSEADADRFLQLVRSRGHGHVGHHREGRRADRALPARRQHAPLRRDAAAARDGARREGPGRRRRSAAGRLLQGRSQERAHLRDGRGHALLDPRGLGGRQRRWRHAHAARPRLGLHQHRRREGVSRRGRGGDQAPRRREGRRGGRRPRREVGRGDHGGRLDAAAGRRRRDADRPRQAGSSRATRRRSTWCSSTRSTARPPARPISSARARSRSLRSGSRAERAHERGAQRDATGPSRS